MQLLNLRHYLVLGLVPQEPAFRVKHSINILAILAETLECLCLFEFAEQLTNCLNDLNTKHNSIKFKYKKSQASIAFLDTEVFVQNKKLFIKSYEKAMTAQTSSMKIRNILYH